MPSLTQKEQKEHTNDAELQSAFRHIMRDLFPEIKEAKNDQEGAKLFIQRALMTSLLRDDRKFRFIIAKKTIELYQMQSKDTSRIAALPELHLKHCAPRKNVTLKDMLTLRSNFSKLDQIGHFQLLALTDIIPEIARQEKGPKFGQQVQERWDWVKIQSEAINKDISRRVNKY